MIHALPPAPAVDCDVARLGRRGRLMGVFWSAMSLCRMGGGRLGLTKGSSGGCCETTCVDAMDGYDLNEGVLSKVAMHSRDKFGSMTVIVGIGFCAAGYCCSLVPGDGLDTTPYTSPASDGRCFMKWLSAKSGESLGVPGRDRSGLTTRSVPGGWVSR